jgi:hypothetical protein
MAHGQITQAPRKGSGFALARLASKFPVLGDERKPLARRQPPLAVSEWRYSAQACAFACEQTKVTLSWRQRDVFGSVRDNGATWDKVGKDQWLKSHNKRRKSARGAFASPR